MNKWKDVLSDRLFVGHSSCIGINCRLNAGSSTADLNSTFALFTGDREWSSRVFVEAKEMKDDSLSHAHTHSLAHTLSVWTHWIPFLCLSGNQLIVFGSIPDQWRSVHKPALQAEQTWWKRRANHLGAPNRGSSGSFGKKGKGSLIVHSSQTNTCSFVFVIKQFVFLRLLAGGGICK